MLPWVYSGIITDEVKVWLGQKCGTRSAVDRVSVMSWPRFDLICDLLLNRSTETWDLYCFFLMIKKNGISSVRLSPYGSKVRAIQNACIVQFLCIWIKKCTDRWLQLKNFSRRISHKSQHWWHWRQRYDQSPSELFCTVFGLFLFRCAIRKYRLTVTKHLPENRWPKWRWV